MWINGLILSSLVPKTIESNTATFIIKTILFLQQFAVCFSQAANHQVKHVANVKTELFFVFTMKVVVFGLSLE
jgi:hypothetical protein